MALHSSRQWPVGTPVRRKVPYAAFLTCQSLLSDTTVSTDVRDAAAEVVEGFRSNKGVDAHVAAVLAAHVASTGVQNRWGK